MRATDDANEELVPLDDANPELMAALAAFAEPAGSSEALVALFRDNGDGRLGLVEGICTARCRLPGGYAHEAVLARGGVIGCTWEIHLGEKGRTVGWRLRGNIPESGLDSPDDEDEDDEDDEEMVEWHVYQDDDDDDDEGDEQDEDERGEEREQQKKPRADDDDEGDDADDDDDDDDDEYEADRDDSEAEIESFSARPGSKGYRRALEVAFAEARTGLILRVLGIDPNRLDAWRSFTTQPLDKAVRRLGRRTLKFEWWLTVRRPQWLCYLAGQDPPRYTALITAVLADPELAEVGYEVLNDLHPDWTERLPGFAPPDAVKTVEMLVGEGAWEVACEVLNVLSPGWQTGLPTT